MRDYPFNFSELVQFSESDPYQSIPEQYSSLSEELLALQKKLNFPAVRPDIGLLFKFLLGISKPKTIFEMGSGYGHSAFWYLLSASSVEKVYLTEKREDLKEHFENLSWPSGWREKLQYEMRDAFEVIEEIQEKLDFVLIDGVKADYLNFLKKIRPQLSENSLIAIDNSYWRGSFLNSEQREKKQSARNIFELHEAIKSMKDFEALFIPYQDGLTLLRPV